MSEEDFFVDTATMPLEDYKNMKEEIERLNTTIQSNINSYNKLAKYSSDLEDRIDKAKTILENIVFYTTPTGEVIHLDEKIKDINKAIKILRK